MTKKSNNKTHTELLHLRFTMSFDYNCLLRTGSMPLVMFVKHLSKRCFVALFCVCISFIFDSDPMLVSANTEHSSYLNVKQIARVGR